MHPCRRVRRPPPVISIWAVPLLGKSSAFFPLYSSGPETVNSSRLKSFLPSTVQIAPSASQSVVAGRTIVTSPLPSGSTVISHRMLLGLSSRWALRTSPPDTVNAKSLRVL